MASITHLFATFFLLSLLACSSTNAQLTANFYATTCPNLQTIVRNAMRQAVAREARIGASVLRLFFHDCFVNGFDASILLDDTATFPGEKNVLPNQNSARGFEVTDAIKTNVEAACNATISCADILALATRDGVVLLGGPSWAVPLGRRDSRTASQSAANTQIPAPVSDLATLTSMFVAKADGSGNTNLAPLDTLTPTRFDNNYYRDLVTRRGLLHSDQELFNGGSQDALVRRYSINNAAFFTDFAAAMVRMGNISPLTGTNGEIRRKCRMVN
ncbi:Peroxidase [Quillaja saponaria]|uniref:peroxidase n=1 Tax=Quillaja saponaria TaxID=32244 RepID=A0AAD7QHH3_QUISA|nr:Peroxidase [Quillaja saponaria]